MKPQSSLKKSPTKAPAERVVKDIRRATRRHFSAEDKIRIVLDGLRGKTALPSFAARKALPRACITPGRRNSWRLVSAAWPVTQPAPRLLVR
jgi:hypothetical protein